ncbi:MAG: CPBP family intramembrane glutamic endopeptidase [Proteocatella sp.]
MLKAKTKKLDIMWMYVIFAYLLFGVMVLGICGTASMVFHASSLTMRWLANLCAWSPTFALLIMFKKLKPDMSLKDFYRRAFSGKIKMNLLILTAGSVIGGTLLSIWILSIAEEKSFASFFNLGTYSMPLYFLLSFLSGPTGEESGWRGYLRYELENRYGFVKGSLVLGVVWAFWHTVLWFVDSDFAGLSLIPYIISNVVVMTSLVIIMNVVLKRSDNLFYAIWIHFCFNFLYGFLEVDIWFYVILSIVYAIIAACFLIFYLKVENITIQEPNGYKI